ncbi:KamA family radical SAM protein [Carboxylicivirga sp. M1479]|uniref:KamA family radical SAM protein n=1 Tax=Carboxylicivirga sp. M1479 TaxID=2594476 RepID=UPI001178396B|nr:radical SAM protein [Carboxylicivirga sp. M1479]TRX63995.1 radical SAM protein [Carboxylicivirga sp. M1479]
MKYSIYALHNYRQIPQIERLTEEDIFSIEVVGTVLPFKTNSYVVNELIDWDNYKEDPIFILTFPQKGMLEEEDFNHMAKVLKSGADKACIKEEANKIREKLNPHPAGQMEYNVPELNGVKLTGVQHKYDETMLFFPAQGQTCHAYCTFCFRWPQFTNMDEMKFAMKEIDYVIEYLRQHPEITDLLITGGDPMVMKGKMLDTYLTALIDADIPHLKNIRIGSKTLGFWPYRYLTDSDADEVLAAFKKVTDAGISLAFMAHFNHYRELETEAVQEAIKKIRATGVQIRTQSPLLNNINAKPEIWSTMWQKQVSLGLIPYYMFIARDTGAQKYFGVSLVDAWKIFQKAYQSVSGICRTVRGPSMSCTPGKVRIVGVTEVKGEKAFVLEFIQGRESNWVARPFFAKYDDKAVWMDDLKPAFGNSEFFFEQEFSDMFLG